MTRSEPGDLHPYDPKVDRIFHRLSRNNRSTAILHDSVVHNDSISNSVFESSSSFSDSESEFSVDTMADNNWTLKELATPIVVYQSYCIQYNETEVSCELKPGLIHLLPKFHGLAGENPHKHLKDFHVVCSTMRPQEIQGGRGREGGKNFMP